MTSSFARTLAIATVAAVLAAVPCTAQSSQAGAAQEQPQSPKPAGKVIFSRSTDESGAAATQAGPAAGPLAKEPTAEDADRRAVTFTDLDLDVHLQAAAHRIAVRALVTVRNDGNAPLTRIPLQISSSLNWEQIRIGGKDVAFPVAVLNSDADHTGQLHEAAVPLAQALAPGATLQLDARYSGEVTASAQRLLAVGTPEDIALRSDWDQITVPFTGLRGFGNVVWYPVSSVPVILGDGARLFDEIGTHKLRLAGAHFRLRLTVEFPYGQPPTIALINGQPANLTVTTAGRFGPDVDGIATASAESGTLGFVAPSLFVAIRKAHPGANLTAWTLAENEVAVQSWLDAATAVTPFLQDRLGRTPRIAQTLLDLPDPEDAPYETGALLAISLHEGPADRLNGVLVHALAHAWVQSPRAWVSEGVATFMGTLWVEKQRGRDDALGVLEADRAALALAEPSSPGESAGQPLAVAISPVYYRTKAAYVLWMLRDMIGDEALFSALSAYDPAQDTGKAQGGGLLEELVKKASAGKDLSWFFADWVDADKGLPDLSIESVFPSPAQAGAWLVAVNLANSGYAAAEVPVTVRTAKTTVTERVLIPARGKVVKRLLVMGKPTEVQANDGTVPETEASVHVTHLEDAATAPAGSSQSNPPPQ
jgi:hypothetical protein